MKREQRIQKMFVCSFISICFASLGISVVMFWFIDDLSHVILLVFTVTEVFFRVLVALFYFYAIIYYSIMFEKFIIVLFEAKKGYAWLCRFLVYSMSLSEIAENVLTHSIQSYRLIILNMRNGMDCAPWSGTVFVDLQYLVQANT